MPTAAGVTCQKTARPGGGTARPDIATLRHDIEAMCRRAWTRAVFRLARRRRQGARGLPSNGCCVPGRGGERGLPRLTAGHSTEVVVGPACPASCPGGEDFEALPRRVRARRSVWGSDAAAPPGRRASPQCAPRPPQRCARAGPEPLRAATVCCGRVRETLRAKVGEVVGLATPATRGRAARLDGGLIRWIRSDSDGFPTGRGLLARRALPVGLASRTAIRAGASGPTRSAAATDGAGQFTVLASQLFTIAPAARWS